MCCNLTHSLRMISINSEDKEAVVVVSEGAREGEWETGKEEEEDEAMQDA